MNKKEILEIRKLLKKENTRIDRIAGCYVSAEKEKKALFEQPFYLVGEEESFKYSDIFRKALSGTIGKNLNTLEFTLEEEMNGGRHAALMQLTDSALNEEAVRNAFYDQIIGSYAYTGNYLILLAHGMYDIPSKSSDGTEVFDASEYVYRFILCCICPVNLSKPGLCYDAGRNAFVEHLQDWMVEMPSLGFLFPAFQDRNTDVHSLLYYTKNPEEPHPEISEEVLGCVRAATAKEQKSDFNMVVEDVFGENCTVQAVREIHENLNQMLEENREEPDPLVLDAARIRQIFTESGASEAALNDVFENYQKEKTLPETFMASNVAAARKFEVKSPDVTVRVNADRSDLIETRMIDGEECLVIPLTDGVLVNGIAIRPRRKKEVSVE